MHVQYENNVTIRTIGMTFSRDHTLSERASHIRRTLAKRKEGIYRRLYWRSYHRVNQLRIYI